MTAYIIRRLLFVVPTLFVILLTNFAFIQFAPGGPVELAIARIQGTAVDATARVSGGGGEQAQTRQGQSGSQSNDSQYRGARGLDPRLIAELEKQFGFDKPAHERFVLMVRDYLKFDFGQSFYQNRSVVDLVIEKMPVSISIGVWTTLLVYLISIPLGIAKAVRDGSAFDVWTSVVVIVGNAIPSFLFAVLLVVLFAGGSFFNIFPLRGLVSPDWNDLNTLMKIADYLWHMVLPISAMVIGGFASLTILTKNSFLEEINKQYVLTARSKGLE